jgi:hypothetical protein
MHDPRVGRFFAIDPLTSKYPWYSPYQFSGNRVIDMIELEGCEPAKPNEGTSTGHVQYVGNNNLPNGKDKPPYLLDPVIVYGKPGNFVSDIKESVIEKVNTIANIVNDCFGAMTGASSITDELNAAYNPDYAPATDAKSIAITYGIIGAPLALYGAAEAGAGTLIAGGYDAYCTWFAGTSASTYMANATFSGIMSDLFVTNSLQNMISGFTITCLSEYITSGFNPDKIRFQRNFITSPLGGFGGGVLRNSFQQDDNGKFRFSTPNEFAIEFSMGKVSDKFSSEIKLLKLPKFNPTMGTYSETILLTGSESVTGTIDNNLKEEFNDKSDK